MIGATSKGEMFVADHDDHGSADEPRDALDGARPVAVMELHDVHKRFGATRALDGAGIVLYPGEVHALVGENGAGKSTLIKTMTGVYQPDEGTILIDGEPIGLASAADAQQRGVVAIYQEPMIFPDLSVAENIFIGHRNRGAVVHWRRMYDEAAAILGSLDIDLDPRASGNSLAVAAQQTVEIAKAISLDARVLIMDEPTASLSAHEVNRLFDQVHRLRARGVAVLFISHRLDEVFSIADRITVFRDGRRISTAARRPTRAPSWSFARWSAGSSATSSCAPATSRARCACRSRTSAVRGPSRT